MRLIDQMRLLKPSSLPKMAQNDRYLLHVLLRLALIAARTQIMLGQLNRQLLHHPALQPIHQPLRQRPLLLVSQHIGLSVQRRL
jgi:hypothetical protein